MSTFPEPLSTRLGLTVSRSPVETASVPVSAAIAIVSGVLAGVLGTGVHANIWHLGPHLWIPWGAVLALGLLLSLCLWSGTTTRRIWAAAVPGLVAYAVSFVLAFAKPDSALIALGPGSAVGISGLLWFGGILLVTLAAVVIVGRWWRRRRRERDQALVEAQTAAAQESDPLSS